jgi:uncharacterized protein YecE (DUF72 family)
MAPASIGKLPGPAPIFVGCAGWSIPGAEKAHFPEIGTHLERYAALFPAVEINSSFYRPHRATTYERWAAAVPAGFRFAVKIPKAITHIARLENIEEPLARFIAETAGLGDKLGCLLVQLPPSLAFEPKVARRFFKSLRVASRAPVAFEPRHATWFEAPAEALLQKFRIARVAADPAPVPAAAEPGGWPGLAYYRLHGSPRMYYSAYSTAFIRQLSRRLTSAASGKTDAWCIFDNTALGAAMPNARQVLRSLKSKLRSPFAAADPRR